MDDFEKEYFAKLTLIAEDYRLVRNDLAHARIKRFVAALVRQITVEKREFDYIVGAGNSGLFMTKIARMVFEELEIPMPPVITLPIFRFREVNGEITLFDNSVLAPEIPIDIPKKSQILFIDDEIYAGLTVKAVLELFLDKNPQVEMVYCTIIAEHHFFEWHHKLDNVSVHFFAYARLIQGLNGNIGYYIPVDLFEDVKKCFTDVESYNHAMGIVIGGALKRKNQDGVPFFDTSIRDVCIEKIPHYSERKEKLLDGLKELVKEAIKEYKEGRISFKF